MTNQPVAPEVAKVIREAIAKATTAPQTWESTATVISRLIGSKRPPTPDEQMAIDMVYGCADALAQIEHPIQRRRYVDDITNTTSPRQRFLAFRHTPPDSPRWRPLIALIDEVVRADPNVVVTNGGVFTRQELAAAAASITPTEIRFPRAIVNGNAVYRTEDERSPDTRQFGADLYTARSGATKEWWEK